MLYTPLEEELTASVAIAAAPRENEMNKFRTSLVSFCRRSFFSYSVSSFSSSSSPSSSFFANRILLFDILLLAFGALLLLGEEKEEEEEERG